VRSGSPTLTTTVGGSVKSSMFGKREDAGHTCSVPQSPMEMRTTGAPVSCEDAADVLGDPLEFLAGIERLRESGPNGDVALCSGRGVGH